MRRPASQTTGQTSNLRHLLARLEATSTLHATRRIHPPRPLPGATAVLLVESDLLAQNIAAIDVERLADDVFGVVGSEESRRRRDFVRQS